ncbi:MAG: glycosyltransferase family 4 protein [Gemmatimonadetes bacterium]|nr:glycosyltransferase family 4 protein [Gemmatimonadota bacterium]
MIRIGLLVHLAPRKRGSLEDWIVHFAAEAARRGHRLDVFAQEPIQPGILDELRASNAGWFTTTELMRSPVRARRRLAREYDVLHVNLFSTRSALSVLTLLARPARVLFVDHASRRTSGRGVRASLGGVLDRVLMGRTAGVAGVSGFVTRLDRARLGLAPHRLRTIYNGVDVRRFHPGEGRDAADDATLITASQLIPEKGVIHVIEALAGLPECSRLRIAGDGPDEARLRSASRMHGVADRTEFLGVRSDLHELYRRSGIYVHPAVWQEAFGISIAEAMASGCAVVASEVGAIPELIEHEVSGLIVPPADVPALQAAIRKLIDDPALRRRLAANARERAVRDFSIEKCIAEHLDWCEEIADAARARRRSGPAARESIH